MDLKIYTLAKNLRLWLDSWQYLKIFAKIISVTFISGVTVENILPESVELLESLGEEFPRMSLFTLNLTSKY